MTIFSKARHTRAAIGADAAGTAGGRLFVSSGVYSVKSGETLRQLVQRSAGGLSPEALSLWGGVHTRIDASDTAKKRLVEYIDQIQLQEQTRMHRPTRIPAINAQDTAAAAAAQTQNQNVINNLRQVQATGRIVLELTPDSHDVSQLPDLPLEDGDRFIVPRVPLTVIVDGSGLQVRTHSFTIRTVVWETMCDWPAVRTAMRTRSVLM